MNQVDLFFKKLDEFRKLRHELEGLVHYFPGKSHKMVIVLDEIGENTHELKLIAIKHITENSQKGA